MTRSSRPRIVVVSHLSPFPAVHGNRSRLAGLLQWLRDAGFAVTFILQPLDVEERSGFSRLAELVDRLEVVQALHFGARVLLSSRRVGGHLARRFLPGRIADGIRKVSKSGREAGSTAAETGVGEDGHIDRWCWPATCRAVERAVRRDRPIAVMTEYALLSKCLETLPAPTLRLIDTVEVFFRNRERFQIEGLVAPFVCTPDSELVALSRADVLVAIHRNDAQALKQLLPRKRVITVAHSYRQRPRRPSGPDVGTILYVASSNPFNAHGLQQFLAQAWRLIVSRVPGATLRVVGSVSLPEQADDQNIVHVGRVTDAELVHEYQTAHVVINPQVAGTGLKIKCVEALSAGCSLVVNQAGADGLEEEAGSAFLVAKDWQDFASHVVTVLTDNAVRRELEVRARAFAARAFSPAVTFSELAQVLGPDLGTRRRD